MTLPQHLCVCVGVCTNASACVSLHQHSFKASALCVYVRACLLDHLWHRQIAFLNAE